MTEAAVCPVPHENRTHPLGAPAGFEEAISNGPVKMLWPNGVEAWVVSSYAGVRQVLSDRRFSANKEGGPEMRTEGEQILGLPQPGNMNVMDGDEHLRLRRPLSRAFMVKRLNEMRPRIQEIVDQHFDEMERGGEPADLVSSVCLPVPSLVIAELLGVGAEHQALFQATAREMLGKNGSKAEYEAKAAELGEVLAKVVDEKKASGSTDDLIGLMVNDTDFEMDELLMLAIGLLVAGHETTSNFFGLFTLTLFENPDQLAVLKRDPSRADVIVEELLRYTIGKLGGAGIARRALEDVEVDGVTIRAGDWVTVSSHANLDEQLCPHASELDLERRAVPHLGFGFGPHQCLGANLARVELQILLRTLFTRFPNVRPAIPVAEMAFREDMITYGAAAIPVVWS
ncbi:cytochrome P450 [Lentzea aerocolonigenes]|uniref:cytochrome P450 n=1 Tax=Lentzea aerocolonigenes TaxID=68170 RepID=UPI000692244F|nr:cytochrome P450 [Lentzea aerocolonigenes]MCP2248936.1 Cytochrome P450 [Lentzea aerocolonigenes]